jgi:hypothetical protein
MPYYYDLNGSYTTSGTPATEVDALRGLTIANQNTTRIMSLVAAGRNTTAGGGQLRLKTFATASTAGSAQTPAARNSRSPAAESTWFTGPTAGATPTVRLTVGWAQTGGTGGVMEFDNDSAIALRPNGGANGNVDLFTIAASASMVVDSTLVISEG